MTSPRRFRLCRTSIAASASVATVGDPRRRCPRPTAELSLCRASRNKRDVIAPRTACETTASHVRRTSPSSTLIKLVDDGALTDLGAYGLLDTLQTLERVRNKLPVLDRAMIAYGTEQGVPAALSETDHAPCPHHRTPPLGQGSVPTRQSRR